MQLSDTGKLAEQFWMDIPNHFAFVELGNFVIMRNYTRDILMIDKSKMQIGVIEPPTNNKNGGKNDNR